MGNPPTSHAGTGVPPIRFANARGARIAYQDYGEGPTIVAVPPTAQNIEAAWEWPDLRSMFEGFGSFSRWIQFDKRGTGASDRRSQMPGIDERVHDLEAVMAAADVERCFLYGASEGGPMCLLFAATYPERVEGVILHGSGAYTEHPDLDDEGVRRRRAGFDALCQVYGTEESPMVDGFAPSLAGDPEFRAWHQRYERIAADSSSLRELLEISLGIDVRHILPAVEAPVLLLHRTGDLIIPIDYARETAGLLSNAQLIEYEGSDHFAFAGDRSWMDDLERFVTGTVSERAPQTLTAGATIQTLGGFSVAVDGVEVPTAAWGSRHSRQLCKRLVAARGWPVTRELLFDQLWPDESDTRKLGARLSVQLSAVRRVLDGGVIADRETVALDVGVVQTDLQAFFEAEDSRAIVDLYVGEFLPEDQYDDWTSVVRDEARRRFVTAAKELADEALDAGDAAEVARLAYRILEVDDYEDHGHRLLVRALLDLDRVGEARRAHGRWSSEMSELGIDVSPFSTFGDGLG